MYHNTYVLTTNTKYKKPDDADRSMMYQSISSVVSSPGDIVVHVVSLCITITPLTQSWDFPNTSLASAVGVNREN